jgi:hypothetical protein
MQGTNMRVNAPPFRVTLNWGTPLTVAGGEGTCITARRGSVWITQDNDLRDVVLSSGESFLLDHPDLAIVQAFDTAEILVVPPVLPAHGGRSGRWLGWLAQALPRASHKPAPAH